MAISGRITRFNMHQLSVYDRMQFLRSRRSEAAAIAQKSAALANSLATIQVNNAAEQGNLFSKIAMQRLSRRV